MRDRSRLSSRSAKAIAAISFVCALAAQSTDEPPWQAFVVAAGNDERAATEALKQIGTRWRNGYAAMIIDLARLLPSPRRRHQAADEPFTAADDEAGSRQEPFSPREGFPEMSRRLPGSQARQRLTSFLEKQTGQKFGDDLRAWRRWVWAQPDAPHAEYATFKGELYARIDPAFRTFFPAGVKSAVRLDEIDWGGVEVNGIPPLRSPKTISAAAATWLRDKHVVFGIEVNGEARAYPKRILAWHEMAIDRLGGVDLTIVYCTLCGTVIPYESVAGNRRFTFGTSGLLYRSNKLMFDEETRSLWSSLEGIPVVGPLVGSDLQLRIRPVVTTTWGEWKREYPATTVLSLDTGFTRDYSEGAAYRDYFATDRIMFEVPRSDARLRNKAEVLVLRPELLGPDAVPVAIAVDLLKRQPRFTFEAAGRRFEAVTSPGGANRIYELGTTGERVRQIPAHRAFWFGWYAQHPDTQLYR